MVTLNLDRKARAAKWQSLPMCVDVSPPFAKRGPSHVYRPKITALKRRLWKPGQTLLVEFLDGHVDVKRRVLSTAKQWEAFANIHFELAKNGRGDIRVAFTPGVSWSAIGSEAASDTRFRGRASMNLSGLEPNGPDEEYRRVVLHEFGHALGCVHEHSSPKAGIKWNRDAAYAFFGGKPNYWKKAEVEANVFWRYSAGSTNSSAFDPDSIMIYAIPPSITSDGFSVAWNTDLSATDKAFIQKWYPS